MYVAVLLYVVPLYVVSGFSQTVLQQTLGRRLADALKSEPGLRLLFPPTDLPDYPQVRLQKLGYWPPWLELDLDRD